MTYKIATYTPEFLEKQVEIGHYNLSQWLGARQTPIQRLSKIYSRSDFDPETKFYALKDNDVVGFLTSKIRKGGQEADLEFPILAEGHADAGESLMDYAFEQLKSKGVSKIYTRVSDAWGNTMLMASKYNYEKNELMWKNGQLKVENYQSANSESEADEVTKSDFDDVKEVMVSFRQDSGSAAQAQIDKLVEISERVTSWKIIREEGIIVGHDHLVEDILDGNRARMNAIYATRSDIRDRIMNSHVAAARKSGISLIENFFWGPTEDLDGPYRDYGFKVGELWSYTRDI